MQKIIKVQEATNLQLDWLVAKCEGINMEDINTAEGYVDTFCYGFYSPTTDWSQGGPIIEREELSVERRMPCMKNEQWGAHGGRAMQNFHKGPTPLIAAMRCFVASKLGETAKVPEELL